MSSPPAAAPAVAAPPRSLDDLMLAMDVVDTLRHSETLVARELDEGRREAELLERLRTIYRNQGIEVPDRILREGVQALKESRFAYTPPPPGLATTLARLWVMRGRILRGLAAAAGVLLLVWAIYHVAVVRPRERAEEALTAAHAAAVAEARVPTARDRADALLAEGAEALRRGDREAAAAARTRLEALRVNLPRAYSLHIVGETSRTQRFALHRRDYYLIVEARAPDGGTYALPVAGEDGAVRTVSRWGVRVPEETYVAVERDRRAGTLQRDRLGEKRPGEADVTWLMPVQGETITQW